MEKKRNEYVLEVTDLKKYFPVRGQKEQFVKAIDGINFKLKAGETLGLVGESGSGKSTTAYNVIGMEEMTGGQVRFKGQDISMPLAKRPLELKKEIQIVFQDPGTSLNPQRNIFDILSLPLKVHKVCGAGEYVKYVARLMDIVELPYEYMYKYPSTLSGGERQMVAIARALATNPSMIILDEPTSALDVSVQAKIINTLLKLQKELNLTYLFITHDLSVVKYISDRICVMYLGNMVELSESEELFKHTYHPYTEALLSAIPTTEEDNGGRERILLEGDIPSPVNPPSGCKFHTRCRYCQEKCKNEVPEWRDMGNHHYVACHFPLKQKD